VLLEQIISLAVVPAVLAVDLLRIMHLLRHRAKCVEDGIPQRHNASAAICLGCVNYLAQDRNIDGILLNVMNDLNVLHNPKVL